MIIKTPSDSQSEKFRWESHVGTFATSHALAEQAAQKVRK